MSKIIAIANQKGNRSKTETSYEKTAPIYLGGNQEHFFIDIETGHLVMQPLPEIKTMSKIIAIANQKGGVGKTTTGFDEMYPICSHRNLESLGSGMLLNAITTQKATNNQSISPSPVEIDVYFLKEAFPAHTGTITSLTYISEFIKQSKGIDIFEQANF